MDISCGFRSQPNTHAQTTNAEMKVMILLPCEKICKYLITFASMSQTEYLILIIQHDAHVIDFCEFIGSRLGS